jgi:hypothetical protein
MYKFLLGNYTNPKTEEIHEFYDRKEPFKIKFVKPKDKIR